ncbi:relaxase domain-containing protein [Sphingobium yanoikuyae]|jgi:conjugative relaxase-like TrwC/TraI family protein|uniref:Relaxase domain-containing protein n=1 Tax=Sphingobium yanoikuyae TaxID=13690 RepID=A0AA42X3E2_SPHYA|nr:MobF family relaxase [Sphingobium yanoikuyae]MDH2135017.1 relaxase domain-containing protein [Sphingobium yanoikuyae]MDH2170388.1 relaxase domain-containing protein [Sphingobium yanoikuyae]
MIQPQRLHGKPANIARYYTVGDYYTKGGNEPSEWGGKLAADLGLFGPVDTRQFRDLLAGKVGDQQLGRHRADGQIQHHPGWDFAVNAPKSVSIMALVAGDERVLAAHEHAVTAAITYLEEQAQLRRREEGKIVHETTGRILVARFTEHGSRELDPHLHTHLVVLNMTNRQDGDPMASLESRVMYGEQRVAGQIYRNALAFSLREAGYEVEFDPRTGLFEIRGVPKELIERFSQRAEAIEEHAREHGLVGQKAQRASFYATRKAKVKIGAQELTVQWHERTGDQLETLDKIAAVAREREGQHSPPTERTASRAALFGLRQLETAEAVNNLGDILRTGLAAHVGEMRLEDLRPRIETHELMRKLLPTHEQTGDKVLTHGRTTRKSWRLELALTQHIALGLDDARPIASGDRLLAVLEKTTLNAEQQRALVETAMSRDRVTGIHGVAGSGKSTLVRVLDEAAEPGTTLIALAPTSSAAAELGQKANIEAHTVASFVARGGHGITDRHVLVLDEAGQLGNRQARRLLEISRITGARLLFLGDEKQTGAIEQGKPFWLMRRLGLPVVELTEAVRQETRTIKAAVAQARAGNFEQSLKNLDSVTTVTDNEAMAAMVVNAWVRLKPDSRAGTNILVLDNATRLIVNNKIREALRNENGLAAEDSRLSILAPAGFTDIEKHMGRFYGAGQVVRFGRDIAGLGVARHTDYRVVGLGREPNGRQVVRLVDEQGRIIRWDPQTTRARHINVFNPEERDLAEGDRIQWRLVNRDLDLRNAERGTVEKLDGDLATIRWDRDGRVQQVDLSEHKTWDHGYAETVYSSQSKTYPRVFLLAPVESPLVNAQNFYTAITRAMYGVRLWTNNVKELVAKLERQSGEKTSSTEGLGRMDQDRVGPFTNRQGARLATLKAEQEKDRASRRDRALERQLSRRDRGPRGAAEHIAEDARSVAQVLDRFLEGILDRARTRIEPSTTHPERQSPTLASQPEPSQGPER